MKENSIIKRFKVYQITSIITILLTLVGFSYNVWRMEQTEINNNIRTSSFEMLQELSSLEQLIYALHYDKDSTKGNPRTGWVKVGLIVDLSMIASQSSDLKTNNLFETWKSNWKLIEDNQEAVNKIIVCIEDIRGEIRVLLHDIN